MKTAVRFSYILGFGLLLLLFPAALWSWGTVKASFVFINLIPALVILGHIVFSRDMDFFTPLTFLLLNVVMGISLRALYMVMNATTWNVQTKFLIDQDFEFFIFPSIIICLSISLLVLGYSLKQRPFRLSGWRVMQNDRWRKFNLELVVLFLSAIGFTFSYLFFKKTGFVGMAEGLDISNLSQKRFVEIGGKKAAFGYYRWLASFVQFAFFFYLAYFAKRHWSFISIRGIFLFLLGLAALIFPLMVNSRAGVMLNFIIALMIWHYIRGLNVKIIAVPMVFAFGLILFLSISRKNKASNIEEIQENVTIDLLLEAFVGGRHYLGVSKTAHIMEAVPKDMPYKYGATFFGWVFAPIPRTMWPGKPLIGYGPIIVEKALHGDYKKTGGVPSGILGELFWNFGYPGILGGMFMIGLFLKKIYISFKPFLRSNLNFLLIYVQVCLAFGFFMLAGAVNDGVIHFLKNGVLTVLIIYAIKFRFDTKKQTA